MTTPTEEGVHILTKEMQQGEWFLDILDHKHPGGLYTLHQDWVERLKVAAEAIAAVKTAVTVNTILPGPTATETSTNFMKATSLLSAATNGAALRADGGVIKLAF